MTIPYLPAIAPDVPVRTEAEAKVLEASFGDGYVQRAAAGVNSVRRKVTLTWSLLQTQEKETLLALFAERAGWRPFHWTLPGETLPRTWVAAKWTDTRLTGGRHTVTAELQEEFQP